MRKLALLCAFLLLAAPCGARTITVDDDGPADFNDIQAGINDANDGDTVIVAPGTYYENINFGGKNIILRSTEPTDPNVVSSTIIDGRLGGSVVTFSGTETPDCVLSGFKITNGKGTMTDKLNIAYGGGIYGSGTKATIQYNVITKNQPAPLIWPSSTYGGGLHNCDGIIQYNIISENIARCNEGAARGGGLIGCGGIIQYNVITKNSACGLAGGSLFAIHGGGLANCKGIIKNNLIVNNSVSGFSAGSYIMGGGLSRCKGKILNNTIVGNSATGRGQNIWGGGISLCTNVIIKNCIIWNNVAPEGAQLIHSKTPTYSCIQDWTGGGEGNTDSDPCFVDANSCDYHLLPNSTCIDTGNPNYIPDANETDFDGNPRVIGANIDMGAYEFYPPDLNTPFIKCVPTRFRFYSSSGFVDPNFHILSIWNTGVGTLNWKLIWDWEWLQAAPIFGESTGEIGEVVLTVDPDNLDPGFHNCSLTVLDPNAINHSAKVQVELCVGGEILLNGQNFPTIQAAIDAAFDGDTVIVSDGVYGGKGNYKIDFRGKAITVQSKNGPEKCIIDCDGAGWGFVIWGYEDVNSTLNGFTIRNATYAVACFGNSPTITNCIISSKIKSQGSQIHCNGGSPTISNCIISGHSGSLEGAGISCVYDSNPTITNCVITGNSAEYYGGGIYCRENSSPTITNCIITDNGAKWYGGGVCYFESSSPTFTNCTISGNKSEVSGGGIYSGGSSSIITNCNISGNIAKDVGGGIYSSYGDNPTLTNCIIWDNEAQSGPQIYLWSHSNASLSYSDVQGGPNDVYVSPDSIFNWGIGNIDADPCFVEAGYWADACDPNIIVEPNDLNAVWVEGDYHLLEGSACIDAGDPNYIPEPNETDLDGNPRVVDGDNDGNSVVDMGAYERIPEPSELILDLAEDVIALNLHKGISNSLDSKLQAALGALEDENENNDEAAINTLGAFINAVEAQHGKKIPQAEADALIAAAQEIIDLLNNE